MKFTFVIPVAPGRDAPVVRYIEMLDYPPLEFEVMVVKGENPSDNRNTGAVQAKGDVVVFLDDDARIPQDYLTEAERFFSQHPDVDIVGGPQLTPKEDGFFQRVCWYALSSMFGSWKVSNRYCARRMDLDADETAVTSANLLCKREVLDVISFDNKLFPGEDPKFISDAKKAGFKVAYTPTIRLYHRRRPNIWEFVGQIYSYGRARPQKERILDTIRMPFFFIPSLFLAYLVSLSAFVFISPYSAKDFFAKGGIIDDTFPLVFAIFLPLIAYLLLDVFSAIYCALRHKDYKAMFVLPFVFPAIHISYGLGMISGCFRKLVVAVLM